ADVGGMTDRAAVTFVDNGLTWPGGGVMQYVSVGLRLVAQLIDGLVVFFGLGYFIATLTGATTPGGFELTGGPAFLLFALGFAYFVLLEGLVGATLGKLAVGICVRSADGQRSGLRAALVRNVLRIVDALPLFYLVGAVLVWKSPTRQRFGDRVAETVVVRRSSLPSI
ncbi:MAG: RDD family protein, partial [Nitriliruptoraceae bacterium]